MAFFVDLRLCLIVLICNCVTLVVSKEKPRSPETYYAVVNSNASLPCVAGQPEGRLRWYTARPDRSLVARSRTAVDVNDPDLWLHEITGVQLSDAGVFVCTDGSQSSSTELVVFEPSSVRNVEAITDVPDEIKVRWRAPSDSTYLVRGYNIYVTEVGQAGKEVKITVNDVSSDGQEEYTLTDFSPGATYQIQVAPLYVKGVEEVGDVAEGPRSQQVKITPPKFEPVPYNVKAEPWYNSTILVTWLPPRLEGSSAVDGYIVYYTAVGKKDAPTGEVTVTRPDPSNQWTAVLKGLKTKNKYKIQVAPFTGGSRKVVGDKSKEVLVAHDGFVPELSIRAIPVSPDTVLITVDTVGGDKVDKLRILYSDDSAIKWTRVDDYNSQEKYAVVTGLQPRTRYFFNAKASVNKKARSVVTHVQTPPSGLSPPTNISVSAKTDRSVLVTWNHDAVVPAKGFIVLTDSLQQDGSVRPVKQNVVFKQNEAVVDGLDSGEKYQVKVEPFNLESIGTCGDPVLFQLSGADETTPSEPERRAPQFVDKPQDELQINAGDDVRLTCAATGSPHPVVQWYVDNVPHGKPADRVSEIVLSSIQKSTRLTCRASNDVQTIDSQTNVVVTPEIEPEAPRFQMTPDSVVVVARGSDVRLWCIATGNPVPVVSWYKDNVPRASAQGRAEFVESRVSGHFDLKCVARNEFGLIDKATKVYIREYLRSPSLRSSLPKTVEARQGEPVTIHCVFDGVPTPNVTWYNGSTKLGEAALGQNSLKIDSVEGSAVLTCQGENVRGFASQVVELKVIPKEEPRQSDYVVVLKVVQQSPTEVKVKWAVNEGNLNDIRNFQVKLLRSTGSVLLSQTRGSNVRSETFKRLSPNTKYIVNVQTGTSRSVVDNSSVEFITSGPNSSDRRPVVFVDVTEVRDNTAMLEFSTINVEPIQVPRYRVRVIDLATSIGNTILKRDNFRPDTPIVLENLKPNRNYQVIVDALARHGAELLTAIANFTTAGPGQYGSPVSTHSDTSSPQIGATTQPTRRTPPTAAPKTLPTRPATDGTTTEQPLFFVTTGFEFAVTTVEEPENHDYVMTTKIPTKTPYSVDIRWTVDQGPLENIKNFLVTIKGERGNTLLEQTLPENQRYITIQSLNPNTKFFVNVKANGAQGSLVESEVSFQTDPADATPDTTNPVLELEANEVRAHNTRIDWTLVNVEPNLVKNYKMRVLDSGPDGFNLLTQTMPPSSQSLSLQQLQPNKRYHVILEALAADSSVLMTASLTFQTPSENRYGRPVRASSRDRQQTRQVPEQLSRSQASQQGSPRGTDDTSSADPTLELRIQPLGQSSSQLAWAIQNMPVGLVDGYVLKFKRNGPQGDVILQMNLTLYETIFKVDGLVSNKQYFVELDAVSKSGSPVVSASTVYQPGTTVAPIRVTLKQSDRSLSQTQLQEGDSQRDDDDNSKPEIDLELNPAGLNQVKVNWTVTKDNRRRPIALYKIKVYKDGPEGSLLLEDQLNLGVVSYTVSDLMADIRYYIHLDALDKYGSVIEYVGYTFLVPPPGHAVEPIRTSSVFNKERAVTTVKPREPQESPEGQELVILAVEAQDPNTMLVEWTSVQTGVGKRPQETIVRYAEFAGNVRGNFKIESVPPGQQRLVLKNLKPDTTYGIQVAPRGRGGYHVRWSKLIMRKTARV